MSLLLPLAVERGVCVITNMGASMIWKTTARAYNLAALKYWGLATHINFLLLAGMHSLNALFLLGDTTLNSLRFPWFWIS
ncbi:uncharacterized protein LOC131217257 isoform X2 [Magnolia sinica]|uniref:uncharacterized protein LOC131217257 isoform X2 n=1 Tax=Magnolia sinica TaxID=86752 RepID=UPI00265825CC|nr:uncharacterized protein LOC131217257 isoform X2 [Magnolia sinica]